ncbi:MAG TPA: hypothetical protein VFU32_06400 [Ktedonobacterales bacterium]|nr:hypothetical protein [Ktedonobacterales bacterium]
MSTENGLPNERPDEEIEQQQEEDFLETVPEPDERLITGNTREERYFQLMATALRACAQYKPMFGKGRKGGFTLAEFQRMYGDDPFYHWVGIDSPLMYAAHKAAGGMTSIYRQLGIGGEWVFRNVLRDSLHLSTQQVTWSYQVPTTKGKPRTLTLDGRIQFDDVKDASVRDRLKQWAEHAANNLLVSAEMREQIRGVVFEVRQGYKSKDSKRQNADIANASNAYTNFYIPVLLLLSTQIDQDIAQRYTQAQWLLLNGLLGGTSINSTYVFCREVLNYDLAHFFESYSPRIKTELESVLTTLLKA